MEFIKGLTGLLTELRLLSGEVGSEVFLATMCLLFLTLVLFLVMRQSSRNFFTMRDEFREKVASLEKGQKECHEEREQLVEELRAVLIRNEELDKINRESQRRIAESEAVQKTMSATFNSVVKQFLDRME